ncbi:hypothetical protein B7R54_15145 [Subtercola boreus]|uniref:Uncharacterized protein n=1 Tax=Subtercola boreus TaxID=120213 RepID=A0A3E0VKA0_9MICO|nr:hypothetical protein B7R54_15145 [Subtercola boreus]
MLISETLLTLPIVLLRLLHLRRGRLTEVTGPSKKDIAVHGRLPKTSLFDLFAGVGLRPVRVQ